jgi:dTMP kinase
MPARTIAIEGSDATGKETQANMLFDYLTKTCGLRVGRVSFPRYNQTLGGSLLWEVLKSERANKFGFSKVDPKVASKLYAMDREESLPFLRDLIANNDVVIFDRYVESNLLHQGGKFKSEAERIAFAEWLYALEYDDIKLPKPDEIVYLSLPFWLSQKRAALRAQKEGGQLDAVEKDIDYVKAGHEAGIFYAHHFRWSIVECFLSRDTQVADLHDGKELSIEEVHKQIRILLGYAGKNFFDSIP